MIALDEDALICDLAETYRIFNYMSLPVDLVAILSVGLRADSRIKMKKNRVNVSSDTLLLAGILDKLSFLSWSKTIDGKENRNRPESIVAKIIGDDKPKQSDVISFSSVNEFEKARKSFIKERR